MNQEAAIFAGGCFWGLQHYFDHMSDGIFETAVGYTGGHLENPSYDEVCTGKTGHAEAIRIIYDPLEIEYKTLLKHFFYIHDPTQLNRQGPDVGDNYRSAIFYTTDRQKIEAEEYIKELQESKVFPAPIVTELKAAETFWPAETFHQRYTQRTGLGACRVEYTDSPVPGL